MYSDINTLGTIRQLQHFLYTLANLSMLDSNKTNETRGVMTIIYMDEAMKLKEPENPNQENDRRCFLPGIEVGQIANSPLNPIIYSQAF